LIFFIDFSVLFHFLGHLSLFLSFQNARQFSFQSFFEASLCAFLRTFSYFPAGFLNRFEAIGHIDTGRRPDIEAWSEKLSLQNLFHGKNSHCVTNRRARFGVNRDESLRSVDFSPINRMP